METLTDGQRVGVAALEGHGEAGLRLRQQLVEIRNRIWKQPKNDSAHVWQANKLKLCGKSRFSDVSSSGERKSRITFRRCRRHTAPQQGVDGALMAQDLQQGWDVRGVGEGNVVHHSGPLGGHGPRSYGEDETLRRTSIQTKPFVRFPQLRHTVVLVLQ